MKWIEKDCSMMFLLTGFIEAKNHCQHGKSIQLTFQLLEWGKAEQTSSPTTCYSSLFFPTSIMATESEQSLILRMKSYDVNLTRAAWQCQYCWIMELSSATIGLPPQKHTKNICNLVGSLKFWWLMQYILGTSWYCIHYNIDVLMYTEYAWI